MALAPTSSHGTTFNGGTITAPIVIDNADPTTQSLTVDAPSDATAATSKVARFRQADGTVILALASLFQTITPSPTLYLTAYDASVSLAASGNGFSVADAATGNTNLFVASTGAVQIRPPAGSTDTLLRVRTESGAGAFDLAANGNASFGFPLRANAGLVIYAPAAPANGDLNAGECALWFDQTDGVGNTKLMVKGKSADGTVKTATIVLA